MVCQSLLALPWWPCGSPCVLSSVFRRRDGAAQGLLLALLPLKSGLSSSLLMASCVHARSHPTLCDPSSCTLSASSDLGVSQARVLEWVAIPSSRGLPDPGIAPGSPVSPASQADSFPAEPWGSPSLGAQMVKNRPVMQETQIQSLGWEESLGKGMATHSSVLARRIPWTEEPGGLESVRVEKSQLRLSD